MHQIILLVFLGLYFGAFGLIVNLIYKRAGARISLLSAPFIWVAIEFVRANLSFLPLPWALIGHSQYQYPAIIQLSAVTGAYGMSYWIVVTNCIIVAIVMRWFPNHERCPIYSHKQSSFWETTGLNMVFFGCLLALTVYNGRSMQVTQDSLPTVRLSVLQGNISREIKRDPKAHDQHIMETYKWLTREVIGDAPDLIVWPEAATPGLVLKNHALHKQVVSIVRDSKKPFLIGSSEYPKFQKQSELKYGQVGNTALYFSSDGNVLGQYLKIHLVPFGESLPFEDKFTWPEFIVPKDKKTFEIPGKEFTLFSLNKSKFGVLICWEVVFPDLFRQFVKNGANFMLNITNEGWFGDSAAPFQMLAINVFRSVENRVAIGRAANNGISGFIDPYGRIMDVVRDSTGKATFIKGHLTHNMPLSFEKTFYTRHGDIFAYICIAISILSVLIALLKPSTHRLKR